MGHRLSKIYTRTGDGGETGLGDGSRTRKDSPRVVALGEIDELNSAIGVLLAEPVPEKIRAILESIQHDLFDLGGDVSIPGRATMTEDQVKRLEVVLDELNSALPRLKEFILPGGTRAYRTCFSFSAASSTARVAAATCSGSRARTDNAAPTSELSGARLRVRSVAKMLDGTVAPCELRTGSCRLVHATSGTFQEAAIRWP